MKERRAYALSAIVIVALVTLAHAQSIQGEFVSDDVTAIANNPLLRSLDPANVGKILTSFDGPNFIPLKVLSLAIDWRLWGAHPAGYHVTNIALHVANALVVYALLVRLGSAIGTALVIALLWGLHPVQVESVAWISERKNVLSTLFFFLAFYLYLGASDHLRIRSFLAVVVLFVAALLSKINTIVLPAIIVGYEVLVRRRLRARDLGLAGVLLAIGALAAWHTLNGNPIFATRYHGNSLAVTLRTSATVIPRYFALMVDPSQLRTAHVVPLQDSWLDPAVLGSVCLIAAIVVGGAVLAWRRRPEAFWIFWFLVTLSPMLNLVPFPALMADRFLYMPLLGPIVIVVETIARVARRHRTAERSAAAVAAIAVALSFWATMARIPTWRNAFTLWTDWALRTPYMTADQPYGAAPRTREVALLRETIERDGDSAALSNNIGGIAFEERRLGDAIDALERAHRLAPDNPTITLNLGRAYLWSRRIDDARRMLEDTTRLDPLSFFGWLNLARAQLVSQNAADARRALERARALQPDARNWQREWEALERLDAARS